MATVRTQLVLERFNQNMRLLERRRQWSRSWTINMLGMLYTAHGQFGPASPVGTMVNIDGQVTNVDIGALSVCYENMINRVSSGPGFSQQLIENSMKAASNPVPAQQELMSLLGCDIGILVGTDNTAVAPTDSKLKHKIGHGRRAPDGADVVFEQFNTGDNFYSSVYGGNWTAQEFMPSVDHRCSSVWVKIYKTGNPGDLTVDLRALAPDSNQTSNEQPGSTAIATGTIPAASIPGASPGAQTQCTFVTPVDLYAGHRYMIVLHCTGDVGNCVNWRSITSAAYERGWDFYYPAMSDCFTSTNSGSTWSVTSNRASLFQEQGRSQGEFEYGGCELSGLSFSDPNGSFTIRRFFYNNCGSPLTVQEVGIASPGTWHDKMASSSNWASTRAFLIARDVVSPGVTLNNGQLLLVSYVPAITV